jgi:chromosome segregation ATPase
MGLVKAFEAWKASTPEAQLKAAREELQASTEAFEEAKRAAEELKTTIENYDTAVDKLKTLKSGTEEFTETLEEANAEARKLVDNYNLVAGEDYSFNTQTGLIEINEEALTRI